MVQPFQQQHSDQGCPNLDAKRVFTGADKTPDFQVLFQRLEEKFDLPALLVDVPDRRGPEVQMVGDQDDLAFVFLVPNDDAAQKAGAFLLSLRSGQSDHFIGQDVSI